MCEESARKMKKPMNAFDAEGMNAPEEIRRLCVKVANQAGKDLWWNAMAAATELVTACQRGCRAEVERVAKKRATEPRFHSRRTGRE
jgi:hypothetical protein